MKNNLIILAVCVAAIVGLIFFKKKLAGQGSNIKPVYPAETFNALKKIRINSVSDHVELLLKDGKWLVSPSNFPADTTKVSEVLTALKSLQSADIVSRNPERLGEYGLDSMTTHKVELLDQSDKPLASLYIGKHSSIDFSSTFWKRAENPDVFRTPGSFSYSFSGNTESWKDHKLYAFEKPDVRELEVTWIDSSNKVQHWKVVSKGNDMWEMVAPKPGKANAAKLGTMASRFATLTIDEFVKADSIVPIPDSTRLLIKVTLNNGKSHELKAHEIETSDYLTHPSQPVQIKLANWRLNVFKEYADSLWQAPDTSVADTNMLASQAHGAGSVQPEPTKVAPTKSK